MPAQVLAEETPFSVVRAADGSHALHSRVAFRPGQIIVRFRVTAFVSHPTRHSIQIDSRRHGLVEPEALRFMNHSCEPNVVIATNDMSIRAIRPLETGDEITYFYPSTEWFMAEPFRCRCGSARCLSEITGAAQLPDGVLAGYYFADHIEALLRERRLTSSQMQSPAAPGAQGTGPD